MKLCIRCNIIKKINEFNFRKDRNNYHSYCKLCKKESNNLFYQQTKKGRYGRYKKSSIERKIDFNLSYEEFLKFWNKKCYYCSSNIETIGLDRIDNNKGYKINNVVSCCTICNKMKNNLNIEEWLNYIKQIKNFLNYDILQNLEGNENIIIYKIYNSYKHRARRKKIKFVINFDEFSKAINNYCYYCGRKFNRMGIDRVNNLKGYEINNIVSCCKNCNFGKNNLKYSEWIMHLNKFLGVV